MGRVEAFRATVLGVPLDGIPKTSHNTKANTTIKTFANERTFFLVDIVTSFVPHASERARGRVKTGSTVACKARFRLVGFFLLSKIGNLKKPEN
jgi:hypothetical protein